MDKVKYMEEQTVLRSMQYKYGTTEYSLHDKIQERKDAYREMFNIGENTHIGHDVYLYRTHRLEGYLSIGKEVMLADHITIDYSGKVVIEDGVSISEGTKIYSHKHDLYKMTHREGNDVTPSETVIKKGAWIGANAIILPGITIGEYAVVGAGSVVTHDVKESTFVGGNPAKFIKNIEKQE